MEQERLFFDDIADAIRVTVQALGGNKVMGCKVWPEKAPDAAARHLSDCLNAHKPEKLSRTKCCCWRSGGGRPDATP